MPFLSTGRPSQGVRGVLDRLQDNIVVSGDKKGQVAIWDFERVHERTVYGHMHRALTNHIRFMGPLHDTQCASAASDGMLKAWHTSQTLRAACSNAEHHVLEVYGINKGDKN